MRSSPALVPFIAAILVSLSAPAPASSAEVTVLLKNGSVQDSVTWLPRPMFSVLDLTRGDKTVSVSYADIEAIIDATGENIAPALLRRRYRPRGLEGAGIEAFLEAESIVLVAGEELPATRFILNPEGASCSSSRGRTRVRFPGIESRPSSIVRGRT